MVAYVEGTYTYSFHTMDGETSVRYFTSSDKRVKSMPLKQWLSLGGPKDGEDHVDINSPRYDQLMVFKAGLFGVKPKAAEKTPKPQPQKPKKEHAANTTYRYCNGIEAITSFNEFKDSMLSSLYGVYESQNWLRENVKVWSTVEAMFVNLNKCWDSSHRSWWMDQIVHTLGCMVWNDFFVKFRKEQNEKVAHNVAEQQMNAFLKLWS